MIVFPSIDMLGGRVVRLVEGDYATAHQVAEDPVETAKDFEAKGATWLHLVDLEGSKSGSGSELFRKALTEIAAATKLKLQCGGGIRTEENIKSLLDAGVSRVVLGSAAVKNPAFAKEMIAKYGSAIAIGVDARNGIVATDGWTKSSGVSYIDFAKEMAEAGADNIIFTDISRDCTMKGPNIEQLRPLLEIGTNITASGGVGSIEDIVALKEIGVYGVISGKAIYSGRLDLAKAFEIAAQ